MKVGEFTRGLMLDNLTICIPNWPLWQWFAMVALVSVGWATGKLLVSALEAFAGSFLLKFFG